jgi:two-component system, NarL family, nitrate/nitrite response regulator NarL
MLADRDRPIRVLVVEDHPIVGQGVADALAAEGGFEPLGVASSLAEVVERAGSWDRASRPDVVLADVDLGGERAFDLPAMLGRDGPPVLFLSGLDGPAVMRAALECQAAGYVHKRQPREDVFDAVRRVASGQGAFSIEDVRLARSAPREPTARERQVLARISHGMANKEIGHELGIEERGVEGHVRRLLDRYGCSNRTELAVLALREGWLRGRG